jgi:2-amino-4-hydroxy-6-hydroxymethyldihydropteridine diphosphokinase
MPNRPDKQKSAQALISFGSNLGDRLKTIREAVRLIGTRCGEVTVVSKIYETEPIGNAKEIFLNGALICATALSPAELMDALLEIERVLGRTRTVKWGDRTIDLDIILWKDQNGEPRELRTDLVTLPHPRATERNFVLVPCCDIASDWLIPEDGKPLSHFCAELPKKMRDLPVHGIPL